MRAHSLLQYDLAVDKAGLKVALKAALKLGHFFSGKTKEDFVRGIKPYMKIASEFANNIEMSNFIKF